MDTHTYTHQMYSDRPASEVLASAAMTDEQAISINQATSAQSAIKVLMPSHLGLMVSDGKVIVIGYIYRS